MLKIRPEQVDALASSMDRPFQREMALLLHDAFPGAFSGVHDGALRGLIADGMTRARALGFTTRGDVRTFLELTIVHGAGFERSDWAREILQDPHLGPQAQIARLEAASIEIAEAGA